jgi:ribosomal protein S18 acetylase RimI-like enzyme
LKDILKVNCKEFYIRLLNSVDEKLVQDLCERCSDFSMLIEGRLPEKNAGHDILFELPPNKEFKDKFVYGVFHENDVLIAAVDIVRDYKDIGEWVLGLLLIDPNERGSNLGQNIHDYIKNMVKKQHGKKLRIAVVEENIKAFKFWMRMGYSETGRVKATYGNKEHNVIIMNLSLQ